MSPPDTNDTEQVDSDWVDSDWVDSEWVEIEEALRASFHAHESLAVSEAAERIAAEARGASAHQPFRTPVARRVVLGAAATSAGLLALSGGAAWFRRSPPVEPGRPHPTPTPLTFTAPPTTTSAENLTRARAEVARLMRLMPRLPGVVERHTSSKESVPHSPEDLAVSVSTEIRQLVSLSPAAVSAFVMDNAPPQLRLDGYNTPSTPGDVQAFRQVDYVPVRGGTTDAYVGAALRITAEVQGADTLVRVTAKTQARPGRAAGGFITGEVISIEAHTELAMDRATDVLARPTVLITDPEFIREVVRALNAMPLRTVTRCEAILILDPLDLVLSLRQPRGPVTVTGSLVCDRSVRIGTHAPLDGTDPAWLAVLDSPTVRDLVKRSRGRS